MLSRILKLFTYLYAFVLMTTCMGIPVLALNPATGDSSGTMLVIMGGLLAVSLVLIIIFFVLSKKKKK